MSSGTIFLIFALLSLSGLGICHKVADFHRCKPSAISVVMFGAATAVLWSYTLYLMTNRGLGLFPPFTINATAVAVFCGACAGIAILTFQIGIRYGRIATSWLVINLSTIMTLPIFLQINNHAAGIIRINCNNYKRTYTITCNNADTNLHC